MRNQKVAVRRKKKLNFALLLTYFTVVFNKNMLLHLFILFYFLRSYLDSDWIYLIIMKDERSTDVKSYGERRNTGRTSM